MTAPEVDFGTAGPSESNYEVANIFESEERREKKKKRLIEAALFFFDDFFKDDLKDDLNRLSLNRLLDKLYKNLFDGTPWRQAEIDCCTVLAFFSPI